MEFDFHLQQFFALALHHLGHRNASGPRDHFGNFLSAYLGAQQAVHSFFTRCRLFGLDFFECFFQSRQLAVLQFRHFVEVALARQIFDLLAQLVNFFTDLLASLSLGFLGMPDFLQVSGFFFKLVNFLFNQGKTLLRSFVVFFANRLALNLQLNQTAVQFVHDLGLGVDFDFDLGSRLVDQVDGLVGQKSVGDVTVAQFSGGHNGRIGDVHAVVNFVLLLQTAQDGDGGLDRRFIDQNFLETALQGGVFLNVFAVFIQCGGTHAMQFATGQCRFEHVARIHGTFGFARTHHGVQLVNENNGHAFVFGQLTEHGFQAFFKLATELGSGEQCGHVE